MSKPLKIVLISAGLILVLLVIAKATGMIPSKGNKGQEVETAEVESRKIIQTVIASGKIQPEVEVKISPEVSGEIIELPVKEGDKVEKGDLLVKINPDIYESGVNRAKAAVKSAQAAVAQAKAQLIEAENNYERNKKLRKDRVISQADFDAIIRAYEVAKLQVESSEYQLESAQASEKEAQDNLKRATIYAPYSGTISMLNVELGERVVGTAQMAGTELLRIANLGEMEVVVEVNENDIVQVTKNDTAIIEVDAYLKEKFKGIVTEIANSANTAGTSANQVTNFEVKIRILKSSYAHLESDNTHSPFRPGMTATVEVQTQVKNNLIAVPIQSVITRVDTSASIKFYEEATAEEEPFEVVFVEVGGKAVLRVVETGIQDDAFIEVKSGISEGEKIIVGPYSTLTKSLKPGDVLEID